MDGQRERNYQGLGNVIEFRANENNAHIYCEITEPDLHPGFGERQSTVSSTSSYLSPVSQHDYLHNSLQGRRECHNTSNDNQESEQVIDGGPNRCSASGISNHRLQAEGRRIYENEIQENFISLNKRNEDKNKNQICMTEFLFVSRCCAVAVVLALITGIGIGIGIGWAVKGCDIKHEIVNAMQTTLGNGIDPVTTPITSIQTKNTSTTTYSTSLPNSPNIILQINNRTYDVHTKTQTLSYSKAKSICTNLNESLIHFNSEGELVSFTNEMKSSVLPNLLQKREFWEFWIDHKTNILPDNSVAFDKLNANGAYCTVLTTWDWNIRQDLYLVTKSCTGVEWRNIICTK